MISIVINNYNYASYLREAVDSALEQKYSGKEVIVVDDGSTDDSRSVLEEYGVRIKKIYKENGGQASAFNAGFAQASGDWILFLDADDRLKSNTLQRWAEELSSINQTCVAAQCLLRVIDQSGNAVVPETTIPRRLYGDNPKTALLSGKKYGAAPTSGNLYRYTALAKIFPMPEADFRICADLYMHVGMPFLGEIHWVHEVLVDYRVHGSNHYTGNTSRPKLETISRSNKQAHLKYSWIRTFAERQGEAAGPGLQAGEWRLLPMDLLVARCEGVQSSVTRRQVLSTLITGSKTIAKTQGGKNLMNSLFRAFMYSITPVTILRNIYGR